MMEFVSRLTRSQAGILGAIGGYALGIAGGPIIKLCAYLFMLVAFYLFGPSFHDRFERHWGVAGMVFAVVAFDSMGGVQRWFANALGGTFQQIPTLALAIFGSYIAVKIHEVVHSDEDKDSNFS